MAVTRRIFMRGGAMAVIGTAMVPALFTRAVLAQTEGLRSNGKRLVVLFQRGAVDGLNVVIPFQEQAYYQSRSSIAVLQARVINLDGFFGLHPAMASLKPFWDAKELAIVHACGSPDPTRSHFDAQDYMESGTPGVKSTPDGWLNRALGVSPAPAPVSAFRAISIGPTIARTLSGRQPAQAIGNLATFGLHDHGSGASLPTAAPNAPVAPDGFAAMYADSVNSVLHGTGSETFEAIKMLRSADPQKYQPEHGAVYPNVAYGQGMRTIAQLMKSNVGVEVAFAEMEGWDTHHNQGGENGQLANRLREWSDSIAAFRTDMGQGGEDVVIVTMSEFGRTLQQNGTGGTDHGHANVMLVMGSPVQGGKVYGKWPGLGPGQLNDDRDLKVTTDFRQVLQEAVAGTLRPRTMEAIFPSIPSTVSDKMKLLKVQDEGLKKINL
jgi:uncharacterized protein (DUF1501 family)